MKDRRRPGAAPKPRQKPSYRVDVVEVLSRMFKGWPGVTKGRMFGFPAYYVAGKLFACVYENGVGLKLPEEVVHNLEGKRHIAPFRPNGKPRMRQWIHVRRGRAEGYLRDEDLFRASVRFVGGAAKGSRTSRRGKRS